VRIVVVASNVAPGIWSRREQRHVGVRRHRGEEFANDAHAIALITSRSVYDSMYLALALRLDTRVITADERFFHALQSFPDLAGSIELLA